MNSTPEDDATAGEADLLTRWRGGDRSAQDPLIQSVLPWLEAEIRRALGTGRADVDDPLDLVQTAVMNFLAWGPKFVPETGNQFRALLKRIAMNELIDARRRAGRRGRGPHLESLGAGSGSFSGFSPVQPSTLGPSREAQRLESDSWVRLALQFLEPDERYLLVASEIEGHDWATIARELGLPSEDTARMRCARLKPRVARLLVQLQRGLVPELE